MSGQPASARVELLTAEVRALMVGSRQVTLSVYRQLDMVPWHDITPFGRVHDSKDGGGNDYVWTIGRGPAGDLVRSVVHVKKLRISPYLGSNTHHKRSEEQRIDLQLRLAEALGGSAFRAHVQFADSSYDCESFSDSTDAVCAALEWRDGQPITTFSAWRDLPLIILAGLR